MTVFVTEAIVLCVLFHLGILLQARKDPAVKIYDYPPAIVERYIELGKIPDKKNPSTLERVKRKWPAAIVLGILLGAVVYLVNGSRSFLNGFLVSYGLWLIVDWYDAIVIDILWFCRAKMWILPGTEDMTEAYHDYGYHMKASCVGMLIGLPVCLLIALVAAWVVSSRNTQYINSVRKALNDLSRGKSGVTIPRQDNIELNEISVAIEDLDRSLQSNAKSRKAWLSSISHDLNTPATAMKIIVDGLNDGVFPADSQTLQQLQKENDSLSDRIGRVIDFSSLQSDTNALVADTPTEQIVSEVLSTFGDEACIKTDIQCDNIRCDAELMTKAVRELLKNAVEYRSGEDQVAWKVFETDDSYCMEVINEGHLSSDMDADFFEPWSRGDWSRTSGGSGLGLPIAATIIQLHKGVISITQADETHVKASISWPK